MIAKAGCGAGSAAAALLEEEDDAVAARVGRGGLEEGLHQHHGHVPAPQARAQVSFLEPKILILLEDFAKKF